MDITAIYNAFSGLADTVPLEERGPRVEVALAKAVAWSLPIPAMKVDQVNRCFVQTCQDLVSTIVSKFNEQYPIDVRACNDLIRELWMVRYTMVYFANSINTEGLLLLLSNSNSGLDYTVSPRYKAIIGATVPWDVEREVQGEVEKTIPSVSADNAVAM